MAEREDRDTTMIAERHTEFGVRFDDGYIVVCGDKASALALIESRGGTLVARNVFVTSWADPATMFNDVRYDQ